MVRSILIERTDTGDAGGADSADKDESQATQVLFRPARMIVSKWGIVQSRDFAWRASTSLGRRNMQGRCVWHKSMSKQVSNTGSYNHRGMLWLKHVGDSPPVVHWVASNQFRQKRPQC